MLTAMRRITSPSTGFRYFYPPRPNHDKGDPRTYFPALKKKQFPAIYLWGWMSIFFNCKEPDIPGWLEDIRVIRIEKFFGSLLRDYGYGRWNRKCVDNTGETAP